MALNPKSDLICDFKSLFGFNAVLLKSYCFKLICSSRSTGDVTEIAL